MGLYLSVLPIRPEWQAAVAQEAGKRNGWIPDTHTQP